MSIRLVVQAVLFPITPNFWSKIVTIFLILMVKPITSKVRRIETRQLI